MKIRTTYEYPPIPIRSMDWSAVDDDTYSGDPRDPIGRGRTKLDAIADLVDQLRERDAAQEPCLSRDEQKVQAARCNCRGSDDYCPCQNMPDAETRRVRAASSEGR